MLQSYLFVDVSPGKGRGVFTRRTIPADTVIEIAPVIVMSAAEREVLDTTLLHDYIFEWGLEKDRCCMALGLVPVYNHSYESNAEYFMDYDSETIMVKTVREIQKGAEVFINYNGDWNDARPLWFEAKS